MDRQIITKNIESPYKIPSMVKGATPSDCDESDLSSAGDFALRKVRFNPWNTFNGVFIPEAVAALPSQTLSQGAKLAYGRLLRYAGRDGMAYPKIDVLAREIGVKPRFAAKYLAELKVFGLIEAERRGMRRSNCYFFLWHTCFGPCPINPDMHDRACHDMHDTACHSIEESHRKKKQVSGRKLASLKVNLFPLMEDDVRIVSDIDSDGNEVDTDKWGRSLKKAPRAPKEGKNKVAVRITEKFRSLCKSEADANVTMNIVAYKMAVSAITTHGLTEEQVYDLFDEWFSKRMPFDEKVQITRALSTNQINGYKARNQI